MTSHLLRAQLLGLHPLVVPGWHNSGPRHWQSVWETSFPSMQRVQQNDWVTPRREDWIARLDEAVRSARKPVLLIAHSLGCATIAHWASRQNRPGNIAGALLVAPADVERASAASALRDFAPLPRQHLGIPTLMVASSNDHCCTVERAHALASDWGSTLQIIGDAGHINADSGLGEWHSGQELLANWIDASGISVSFSGVPRKAA